MGFPLASANSHPWKVARETMVQLMGTTVTTDLQVLSDSRRTVFDATYGERSLNNATPSDCYLGQLCVYTFPKIEEFRKLVLCCGRLSFMWKRDLSRFFLQIPMDPNEYHRVCMVWRGLFFFFLCLAFGLRHSGLQGQRLTDAVSWIHRRQGLETLDESMFNVVNYSDDLGGVEGTEARANESFTLLARLFKDLGLNESIKKAEGPSNQMVYLGVEFDSVAMEMRVPADKLAEIKSEIQLWSRKTTITKKNLQSLLGKLFWVGKVVKFARVFLYIVVTKKFFPVLRKIGTKENNLADYISRRHDTAAAVARFGKVGLWGMNSVDVTDCSFKLTEPW